jgi:hypothetical protein
LPDATNKSPLSNGADIDAVDNLGKTARDHVPEKLTWIFGIDWPDYEPEMLPG